MRCIPRFFLLAAALPAALSLPSPSAFAQEEQEAVYMVMMIGDNRIGVVKETRHTAIEGGVEIVTTRNSSTMTMERLGIKVEVIADVEFVETAEGKPLRFESQMALSSQKVVTRGTVQGGMLTLVTESSGHESARTIPFGADILFPQGIVNLLKDKTLTPGTELRYRIFLPEQNAITSVVSTIGAPEQTPLLNGSATLIPIVSTQDALPGAVIREWVDENAETWKMSTELMGMTISTYRVSRQEAQVKEETSTDLLVDTLVKVDKSIVRPRKTDRVRLKIAMKRRLPTMLSIPEDERQKILRRERDGLEMLIQADPVLPKGIDFASLEGDGFPAASLKANAYIQSDDPMIKELASGICERLDDPVACAYRLTHWVYRNIDKKGFNVVLATAKEVAEQRQGDCSEHAVLLAALARSQGIPARVAVGLVNVSRVFAYHMWTEVWLGRWYSLDAALGQTRVDATHIRLTSSDLSEGLNDIILPLFPVLNNIDIVVEDYTTSGRTVNAERDIASYATFKDRQYRNSLLGVRFSVPSGYRLVQSDDRPAVLAEVFPKNAGTAAVRIEIDSVGYDFSLAAAAQGLEEAQWLKLPNLPMAGANGALLVRDDPQRGGKCLLSLEGNLYTILYFDSRSEKAVKAILKSFRYEPK